MRKILNLIAEFYKLLIQQILIIMITIIVNIPVKILYAELIQDPKINDSRDQIYFKENKLFISLDNSRNYFNQATSLFKAGNDLAALENLNIAINMDPKYVEAYIARGNIAYKNGNFKLAWIDYTQALSLKPSDQLFLNRGMIALDLKLFMQAIQDFSNAIELNPLFATAFNKRGEAFLENRMLEEAKNDFNMAFQLNPKIFSALEKLGDINILQKNNLLAVQNFEKLINIKPRDPELYFKRGQAYEALGDYKKALDDYNIGMDLSKNFIIYHQIEEDLQLDLNNQEEILALRAKFI